MDGVLLLGFALVSCVGIATPGPDVMLAINHGSRYGVRLAAIGIAGVAVSDLFIMSAVAFGLGAILAGSELFFFAAKMVGVLYLAYLGVKLLRAPAMPLSAAVVADQADWGYVLFRRSFLVAFTNVKVWLFFAAFLPQFVDTDSYQLPQYVVLAAIFEILNICILLAYAFLGSAAMQVFRGNAAIWLDRISGVVLLLLALALVFHDKLAASG